MPRVSLALFLALLTVPALAQAVPLQLAHQGRLLDAEQTPLDGTHDLTFRVFDAPTDGTLLWDETVTEDFQGGFYSTILGTDEANPLDDGIFATPPVYLELTVDDGEPLLPRQEINSVPYALRAGTAENVEGGFVDATDISVDGDLVIDAEGNWVGPTPPVAWDDLAGVPGELLDGQDADTMAGLSCADGGRPYWDGVGGAWSCTSVSWAEIQGVPPSLADGDADTLGGLSCTDGGVAKYELASGLWGCATDEVLSGGDVLAIIGGSTLDLGIGSTIDGGVIATLDDLDWSMLTGVPVGLADDEDADTLAALGLTCTDGDRAAWDDVLGEWACSPEEVELPRLSTTGAADGEVLTFDGASAAWLPAPFAGDCSLIAHEPVVDAALFDCGTTEVRVRSRVGFTEVAVGSYFACGLRLDGGIDCWGLEDNGQLEAPEGTFVEVSAGMAHACAVATDGSLACWGLDSAGQATPPSGTFMSVSAGGWHTCAIADTTAVHCWGSDGSGQATPAAGSFSAISAGGQHTCGIKSDDSVECWGYGAAAIPTVSTAASLDSSNMSTCAISTTGTITCWGDLNCCFPAPPGSFTDLAVGTDSACAISASDGTLQCWGLDQAGETSPPPVVFTSIAAELNTYVTPAYTCGVVASTQTIACWGSSSAGVTQPP